jgi:ribosome biogenesis GTPase A
MEDRIKIWVGETLKEICKGIHNLKYSYVILSSKNGYNFDYLLYKIKKLKSNSTESYIKERVYVIGNTNVGKSTFINQLINRSDFFSKGNQKKIDGFKSIKENISSLESLISSKKSELTTSILSGTTIGITKIENIHLGIKVL